MEVDEDLGEIATNLAINGHNLCILGQAGTGKTFLAQQITERIQSEGKTVGVTCSTGTACYGLKSVSARTLHSWAGLDDGRYSESQVIQLLKSDVRKVGARKRILETDVFIIDEISMISARLFSLLEAVCRKLRDKQVAFGGLQILVIGDFFQLPPVKNLMFEDIGEFAFKSPAWEAIKHTVVLSDVKRQDETAYIKCIHEASRGKLSKESMDFITGLNRPIPFTSCNTVHLFARNVEVTKFNHEQLILAGGPQKKYKSDDSGNTTYLGRMQAPPLLAIRRGSPVMLLRNLDAKHSLVNGSLGIVADFDDDIIMVQFNERGHVPIKRVHFTEYDPSLDKDVAKRYQFPLRLAYGMTIHKSQGMTLDAVRVDCSLIDRPGMLGVALGRARSSLGMEVIGFHPRCVVAQSQELIRIYQNVDVHPRSIKCCMDIEVPHQGHEPENVCSVPGDDDDDLDDDTLCEYVEIIEEAVQVEIQLNAEEQTANVETDEISSGVSQECQYKLPADFSIVDMLELLKYERVITPKQGHFNDTLENLKEQSTFKSFCEQYFDKLMTYHVATIKSFPSNPGPVTAYQSKVANLLLSDDHKSKVCQVFNTETARPLDINVVWHVVYHLSSVVETVRQQMQGVTYTSKFGSIRNAMSVEVNSKLRYIAGYVVHRVHQQLIHQMKLKSTSYDLQLLAEYDHCHAQLMAIRSLMRTQEEIEEETGDPDSLKEVRDKQYHGLGLTNLNDDTFKFFQDLCISCVGGMTSELMSRYGEKVHEKLVRDLMLKSTLSTSFSNLFDKNNNQEHIGKLFLEVVMCFSRILLRQWRKDIKTLTTEKKFQHRKEIQAKRDSKAAATPVSTTSLDLSRKVKCEITTQRMMKLKKAELQALCDCFKVSKTGTKADMLDAIKNSQFLPDAINELGSSLSPSACKLLGLPIMGDDNDH